MLRGLEKVSLEWILVTLSYNLRRALRWRALRRQRHSGIGRRQRAALQILAVFGQPLEQSQ
jgi:hypothetical protein